MKKNILQLLLVFFVVVLMSSSVFAKEEGTQNKGQPFQELQANIDAEEAARAAADIDLQTQINTIELTPGPQGDTGPIGPIGPQGIQGEIGPQGSPGEIMSQLTHYFTVHHERSVVAGDVLSYFNGFVLKGLFKDNDEVDFFSPSIFFSGSSRHSNVGALTQDKFVVVYNDADSGFFSKAIIGEISDRMISYGSPVQLNSAATSFDNTAPHLAILSSNKFLVVYTDHGNDTGAVRVGSVSGNVINLGPPVMFQDDSFHHTSVTALSENKCVITFTDSSDNNNAGVAVVGEIAGLNITIGPKQIYALGKTSQYDWSGSSSGNKCVTLDPNKIAIAYSELGRENYVVIGNVSGNAISFGTPHIFNADNCSNFTFSTLSPEKVLLTYKYSGSSGYFIDARVVIGDIVGDTVTFGDEFITDAPVNFEFAATPLSTEQFVLLYQFNSGEEIWYRLGQVSGTTITMFAQTLFSSENLIFPSLARFPTTRFVVSYWNYDKNLVGELAIGDFPYLGNFIGIAQSDGFGGSEIPVILHGISDRHSGLTEDEIYYSTVDGDLTTDQTETKVGLAISSDSILLQMN